MARWHSDLALRFLITAHCHSYHGFETQMGNFSFVLFRMEMKLKAFLYELQAQRSSFFPTMNL